MMHDMTTDESRIAFIKIPDSFFQSEDDSDNWDDDAEDDPSGEFDAQSIQKTRLRRMIDPAIPLPVELPEGAEHINSGDIREEMILSGILRLLQQEPDHENASYYRYFILSVRPDILNELSYAALMKAQNGDFDMALEILDALSGLFPHSAELLNNKHEVLKMKKAASGSHESADGDELFTEARSAIEEGDIERGLDAIRAFIEKNPQVWNAWFLLGWGLRRSCRWADAEVAFREAAELRGETDADTRNEIAICLMEQGDLKAARKELETALHADPENTKIISNLGVLSLKAGDAAEAAGFFRTVLELDPDDAGAREFLERSCPSAAGENGA